MPEVEGDDHYLQFVEACRGNGQTSTPFDYSGPLTEMVLLGCLADAVPQPTARVGRRGAEGDRTRRGRTRRRVRPFGPLALNAANTFASFGTICSIGTLSCTSALRRRPKLSPPMYSVYFVPPRPTMPTSLWYGRAQPFGQPVIRTLIGSSATPSSASTPPAGR
jgi:hypothetical protein